MISHVTLCPFSPPDKNFEDDDSVDGGRSSSSSKGASLSGRKTVSMGSFRRPSSASGSKSAGQRRGGHVTRLSSGPRNVLCVVLTAFLSPCVQGGTALLLALWTRTTSSRPLRTSPPCRLDASLSPGRFLPLIGLTLLLFSPTDLLQQGGGGGHDQDPGRAVRRQAGLGAQSGGCKRTPASPELKVEGPALTLLRLFQLKKVRSLLLAGAADFDGFPQQLRLMEAAFKLSAKDLRSQVVREACITLG